MNRALSFAAGLLLAASMSFAAQAADTVKIGVAGAHSGDVASYGVPSLNAARIVADKINAAGGINGRKVEIVSQDDQCKPELASNAATKLISDGVAAVLGHICTGATKASLTLYNDAKIISVSPTATAPGLSAPGANPMFFRTVARDDAQAALTSRYILEALGAKSVAYIHDNGEYGKGFADLNREALEKAGVQTAIFEAVSPDAVDFSPIVRKLRRSKADVIVFGGYHPTAAKLLQQLRRDRVRIPLVGPDGLKDNDLIKMAGPAAEGVLCSYPTDTSTLPIYKEARDAHVKQYGSEPGFGYYNAYAAMLVIANAVAKAGTETAKIIDVLHTDPVDTPIGTIVFNENGDAAGMGLSIYKVEKGAYVETEYKLKLD